jgi:hypothetical protein
VWTRLAVGGRPLHRQLQREAALDVLDLDRDDLGVDRLGLLGRDQVSDVVNQAAVVAVADFLGLDRLCLAGLVLRLGVDDLLDVVVEIVEVDLVGRRRPRGPARRRG